MHRTFPATGRMFRFSFLAAVACLPALAIAPQRVVADVAIIPEQLTLFGPEGRHGVLIESIDGDEHVGPVAETVELRSSNPDVVTIDGRTLIPVGNGTATITAESKVGTAQAKVNVVGFEREFRWSFRNHVQPILARSGCNSGACHGALAGKGGFKLSLRGYDTQRDHFNITRQARGRRMELSDPGRSLVLAKPSGGIPHKGGLRFDVDSRNYRVIAEWITAGAAPPTDDDAPLDRVEVLPARFVLQPGRQQQVLVRAHYSDGRVEDVTSWAKFTSTNEAAATVDADGLVNVIGYGEGAISVWFSSQIAIARVTVPYPNAVASEIFTDAPRRNFIDELVLAQLQRLNLPPSPKSSDTEFVRRAYLDAVGTLPTMDEVQAFLDTTDIDKRDQLIDSLLDRPEFVDFWTYRWSDLLLINGTVLRPKSVEAYYKWIRGHVEANTPWDQFVRELVTAQGSSFDNGATNFYALHQDPENMAENVSQAFLGLSIACAKCHNHPLEKWTNDQYYGFANLFARVRAKGWGGDGRNGDGLRTLYVVNHGELVQPLTGRPQQPTPLDGEPVSFDSTVDRRIHLASWLSSPENPYFARSITNRVWAAYFGVGLVEPVDDMRASNPASNEELLAAAAQHLVDANFDLKSLMRSILRSETYQRSSKALPENRDELRFYSRYYPRRLMAEVLLDAISQTTEVPTDFTTIEFPGADSEKTEFYKPGTRAIQLYDAAVGSYFLKTFGRNQRRITCECERSDEPSMVQVLHISNGTTVNDKLKHEDNRISRMLAAGSSSDDILDQAYLVALSRRPTDQERKPLAAMLNAAKDGEKREVIEDLFWSIMSSREFLFNH